MDLVSTNEALTTEYERFSIEDEGNDVSLSVIESVNGKLTMTTEETLRLQDDHVFYKLYHGRSRKQRLMALQH